MRAQQIVIREPYQVEVRDAELPAPAANQILVQTAVSAVSPGTELAVWTGTHQWLRDPNLPDWKFPFRSGYSAAGTVAAVGADSKGWKPGDRVSYPGNHASAELLTVGHERGRLWKLPDNLDFEKAGHAGRGDRRRCYRRAGRGTRGHVAGLRWWPGRRGRQPARQGERCELLRRSASALYRGDRGARQHALRAGAHAVGRGLGHRQGP